MSRPPRQDGVLFVHAVPPGGGSTRVAVEDAKCLIAGGYHVGFASDSGGAFPELAARGVTFHRLYFVDPERHSRLLRYLIGAPVTTILLLWIVWRNRYQSLYVQHRQSGWPSRIVSALTGARYVFISHSELGKLNRGRWATPLGTQIIAVAEHVKQNIMKYYGIPERHITVITNAVSADVPAPEASCLRECDRLWGIPPDALVVACVARLDAIKGHDVLLAAWATVARALPRAVLLLVGDGPLKTSLLQTCRDLALTSSVRLLGHVEDVSVVYARADVAALASRSEGMPLCVLEAFSYGVPIVATAVPGVQEIVVNGETGVLVAPEDADGLARALIEVLGNPEERRKMGTIGRQLVSDLYSIEQRGRTLCEFFRSAGSTA